MTERFKIKINIRNSDGDGDTSAMMDTTADTTAGTTADRKSGFAKTMQRSRRFLRMEVAIVAIAVVAALIAIALTPAVDTEVAESDAQPAAVDPQTSQTPGAGSATSRTEESATVSLQTASSPTEPDVDTSDATGFVTADAGAGDEAEAGAADTIDAPPPPEAAPVLSDRPSGSYSEEQSPTADEPQPSVGAFQPATQPDAEPPVDMLADATAPDEMPPMEPEADARTAAPSRMEPAVTDVLAESVGIPAEAVARDGAPVAPPQPVGDSADAPAGSASDAAGDASMDVRSEPDEAAPVADDQPDTQAPVTVLASVVPDYKPTRPASVPAEEGAAIADGEATPVVAVQQWTGVAADVAVPAKKPDAAPGPSETSSSTRDEVRSMDEEPAQDFASLPEPARRPSVAALDHVATNAGGSVARAYLATGIRGREPVDTITESFNFPSEDGREFFYFTELLGLAGEAVVHRWERDGHFEGNVTFPVGSNRWRVYSTKTIAPRQDGVWTVSVRTKDGATLAETEFVVRRP
ncbi:MAG: DUF2914 domain-containing protein [Rhodospirillales bacterium]|nr:DUF2914 domain-containing protein [Rhodospirillales bacterium]